MKFLSLIFILICGFTYSQTHRFIYEYQFKPNPKAENFRKANMVLDVNPDEVKFYDYNHLINDSINKKGGRNYSWNGNPSVKRNRNSFKNSSYEMTKDYFLVNSEDPITWKLSEETKKTGEYTLQKATTDFKGRKWTAWFCKEVNIEEGPYKFCGLPGLIFELSDDEQNFIFKLIKSEKLAKTYDTTDFIENFGGKKPFEMSQKALNKMLLEFYNDPMREIRERFDDVPEGTFSVGGKPVKSKDQLKDMAKVMQEHIRKNHNPIELTGTVMYPEDKKKYQ